MANDTTIAMTSPVGQHLEKVAEGSPVSYLIFNQKKISLVAKMTIGRSPDCSIVIDNKLASRFHASIQKIRDAYFLKDEKSTNGTFLNGQRIPPDKYVKLNPGDKITVGAATFVMS
ncbi:FHA domain-containing protein [Treponema sp.]|jgi:pSer/pThr/pTyr-binding forkhead associated (FHA) protein|uniref:FHA domain-containing protein n=1 Tax=Treponema sp. TaxID=166 RepID=UPI0025E4B972|nr:FHA domain-containing protein [Treponema sp.]MBQ7537587.1 FHA domain-containing protein [Treponema sp.]MBR4321930.1 FHA domain-containing protein [Treponema sp.]